jgi:hypothetical protein
MGAVVLGPGTGQQAHPNPMDLRRIERSLKSRRRYRYVKPSVAGVDGGYRIESPCCSRNIDKEGGVIDIALLLHDAQRHAWQLYRKNHDNGAWELHSDYGRLIDVLELLNADPERKFWQ